MKQNKNSKIESRNKYIYIHNYSLESCKSYSSHIRSTNIHMQLYTVIELYKVINYVK